LGQDRRLLLEPPEGIQTDQGRGHGPQHRGPPLPSRPRHQRAEHGEPGTHPGSQQADHKPGRPHRGGR